MRTRDVDLGLRNDERRFEPDHIRIVQCIGGDHTAAGHAVDGQLRNVLDSELYADHEP